MDAKSHSLKFLFFIFLLTLAAGGCAAGQLADPDDQAQESRPTASATSEVEERVTPPTPQGGGAVERVKAGGVAFAYHPGLASSVGHEVVAAQEMAGGVESRSFPAHHRFSLQGYALQETWHTPHLAVYPAEAYGAMNGLAREEIAGLRALLEARPESFGEALPYLPVADAAQLFHGQERYLSFASGAGIRYLAFYAQDVMPVNNSGLFYTFQGLTDDGVAYVSAIFPVHTGALPDSVAWGDFDYEVLRADYDQHSRAMAGLLNPLQAEAFTPDLAALDALVESLDLGELTFPAGTVADASGESRQVNGAGIGLDLGSLPGTEVTAETVPASDLSQDPWARYLASPAHTVLSLEAYPDTGSYIPAQIRIYPIESYAKLSLYAEEQVAALQALLAGDVSPDSVAPWPYLPQPNSVQIVRAHPAPLSFQNGRGMRYVTKHAQTTAPVDMSADFLYTFQGLSDDGRFYISANLPVRTEALGTDPDFDFELYLADEIAYDAYLAAQQPRFETLEGDDYTPHLAALDALVQSLDLSAYDGPDAAEWAPEVPPAPEQVLAHFLERYVAGGGFAAGAHREDPALHAELAAELASLSHWWEMQGFNVRAYDPLLMTVNEGAYGGFGFADLEVGPAWVEGQTARVTVLRHWIGLDTALPLVYALQWEETAGPDAEGAWQIREVTTILRHPRQIRSGVPEEVVEYVYGLGLAQRPGMEDVGLEGLGLMTEVGSSLCSTDCPRGFAIEGAYARGDRDGDGYPEVDVVLYTTFDNDVRVVTVEEEHFVVTGMIRTTSPAERARAFYTWYLDQAALTVAEGGQSGWARRVPEMARLNRSHFFVTTRLLQEGWRGVENAYLPSGEVPDSFETEPGPTDNTALVHLDYAEDEKDATLLLTFVESERGRWLIDSIGPMEASVR